MATVTKLKGVVTNPNLPILGTDGKLYNYYVGRFINKMVDLGYSFTDDIINAINVFVNNGVEYGWIDKIKYFMPFIGDQEHPLTGIVPLIDRVADYQLAIDSISSDAFTFDNENNIIAFGNAAQVEAVVVPLPVKSTDCGYNSFAPHINFTVPQTFEQVYFIGIFIPDVTQNMGSIVLQTSGDVRYNHRVTPEEAVDTQLMIKLTDDDKGNDVGVFYGRYIDNVTNTIRYKNYDIFKGEASPKKNSMTGALSSKPFVDREYTIKAAGSESTPLTVPCKTMALFDPTTLTANDMYQYNQAVFALTTALGR